MSRLLYSVMAVHRISIIIIIIILPSEQSPRSSSTTAQITSHGTHWHHGRNQSRKEQEIFLSRLRSKITNILYSKVFSFFDKHTIYLTSQQPTNSYETDQTQAPFPNRDSCTKELCTTALHRGALGLCTSIR